MVKFRSPYIVLSSPSGGGKTTIARVLAKRYMNLVKSISATTRPNRAAINASVHGGVFPWWQQGSSVT